MGGEHWSQSGTDHHTFLSCKIILQKSVSHVFPILTQNCKPNSAVTPVDYRALIVSAKRELAHTELRLNKVCSFKWED